MADLNNEIFIFDCNSAHRLNVLDKIAWIALTGGDDAVGQVGNPHAPYKTMQAAYNAGARKFNLSNGSFAGFSAAGIINISLEGLGSTITSIVSIKSTDNSAITIHDTGNKSCNILSVGNANPPENLNGGYIGLNHVQASQVFSPGGLYVDGGNLTANDCVIGSYSANGGAGGGFGGTIEATHCGVGSISVVGGDGDIGGNGGAAFIRYSTLAYGIFDGGNSTVSPGDNGTAYLFYSSVTQLTVTSNLGSHYSSVENCATPETSALYFSVLNGIGY